jgi:putative CocE/NonD family hydrolase
VGLCVVGLAVPSAVASADPTGGSDGQAWLAATEATPQYPGVSIEWDVPITMSDGTVLQANVYRPADASGRAVESKTPSVLNITPYTKLLDTLVDSALSIPQVGETLMDVANSLDLAAPFDGVSELTGVIAGGGARVLGVNRDLVQNGYTQVVVDARGTGFSQGNWDVLGKREQQDSVEVIDWMSKQGWSDGKVGMAGISYSAINSVQAASNNPSALKAIFPVEPGNDLLRDIVGTGGGLGVGFMPLWLTAVNGLKLIPNVQDILQGNFDPLWLASRLEDPGTLIPELVQAMTAQRIEDVSPSTLQVAQDGQFYQDRAADVGNIAVPTMVYGGWHDIFANSEPRIYNGIDLPPGQKQLIMGNG